MLQGVARIQAASFAFMESLCIYGLVIALAILFAKAVHGSLVLLAHAGMLLALSLSPLRCSPYPRIADALGWSFPGLEAS